MKFGKRLRREAERGPPEWTEKYIAYKTLKQLIKLLKSNISSDRAWRSFSEVLSGELAKVSEHIRDTTSDLEALLKGLEIQKVPRAEAADPAAALCQHLFHYVELQRLAVRNIGKKYAKQVGPLPNGFAAFVESIVNFDEYQCGHYIVRLSNYWEKCRKDKVSGDWVPPTSFNRQTAKYLVQPEHVPRIKLAIARHLPVLIFKGKETATTDSGLITSVYLDDDQHNYYQRRLAREEGATLFRFRWYGDVEAPDKIFLERKTHREKWVVDESVKQRCEMSREDALPFLQGVQFTDPLAKDLQEDLLKGCPVPAHMSSNKKSLKSEGTGVSLATFPLPEHSGITDQSVCTAVHPAVRTVYQRAAFQRSDSNAVRISIDTEVHLYEDSSIHPAATLPTGKDAPKFVIVPYAILEVKLMGETPEAPAWVTEIVDSGCARPMPKFSKFGHATASLADVPRVPYWFPLAKELDHEGGGGAMTAMMPRTSAAVPQRRGGQQSSAATATAPLLGRQTPAAAVAAGAPGGGRWSSCVTRQNRVQQDRRLVVEPKTFFANERTFFHWMLPGTVLMVSSITLGTHQHHLMMIPLMVSSAILMMYALYVYYKRIHLITTRATTGYAERFGPAAITFVLIGCHIYAAVYNIWVIDRPVTAVHSSLSLSPQMQEQDCASWAVRMEPGLASSTSYWMTLEDSKGSYVDVEADRHIVRHALGQLATEGLARANSKERSWQERIRHLAKAESLGDSEMHVVQPLGDSSRVVWLARGSPKLPCGTMAELSLDVRCEGRSVAAVVQKPLRDDSVWVGPIDLEKLFPGAGRQLPSSPHFQPEVVAIVEFSGLSIHNQSVTVQLRSLAHHAEVTLWVPGNPQSDPELHAAARNVWYQLLENIHGPEHAQGCDAPRTSIVV